MFQGKLTQHVSTKIEPGNITGFQHTDRIIWPTRPRDQIIRILHTSILCQNTLRNDKRCARKERTSQGFNIHPCCTSSVRTTDSFEHIRNQGTCSH